jgi:hypothetical protein
MIVVDARKDALKIAGRIAGGRIEPSKRAAAKCGETLDEYIEHLKRKAKRAGKPKIKDDLRKHLNAILED